MRDREIGNNEDKPRLRNISGGEEIRREREREGCVVLFISRRGSSSPPELPFRRSIAWRYRSFLPCYRGSKPAQFRQSLIFRTALAAKSNAFLLSRINIEIVFVLLFLHKISNVEIWTLNEITLGLDRRSIFFFLFFLNSAIFSLLFSCKKGGGEENVSCICMCTRVFLRV